jgi:hypothetical protein
MDFVDTGISVYNEEIKEHVYFIKMILDKVEAGKGVREIFMMGLSGD